MSRTDVRLIAIFLFLLLAIQPAAARQSILADIDDVGRRSLHMESFSLKSAQEVSIDAAGFREDGRFGSFNDRDYWPADAWVLNAATRSVVWSLRDADTRDRDDLRVARESLTLPAGDYEVYFASFVGTVYDGPFSQVVRRVTDTPDRRMIRDFHITVRGNGLRNTMDRTRSVRADWAKHAIVSFSDLRDNDLMSQGFSIRSVTEIDVYAVGELSRDEQYDFGWIIDADSRERIWTMNWTDSHHAGGAEKNRVARERLTLQPGNYVAYFMTDGSHSPREWNAVPAYDPDFWGMTIRTHDPSRVSLFDFERVPNENVILAMQGVRNDQMEREGFSLSRPLDVRILAMGESSGRDMVDYGWIVDASTRRTVWTMEYRNTDHAGGASKNRMIDEVIRLDAGDYLAYYVTDGSHAYRSWNAARPPDADLWGLTILAADGPPSRDVVDRFDRRTPPGLLASVLDVRDNTWKSDRFTLDRRTRVRIHAQGEGDDGDMYDFGWIEDARTSDIIWEMTYRKTDHAGGAAKNRKFDGTLVLEPGSYRLVFESDGSHAFGDWNAQPPRDAGFWGIALSVDE